MVYRTFECGVCKLIREVLYKSVHDKVQNKQEIECAECERLTTHIRVFEAPYHTFGMLTKQYTGQLAAVKGHGSYKLDYSDSDLARRRAVDATQEYNEKAGLDHLNKSINKRIADEQQART